MANTDSKVLRDEQVNREALESALLTRQLGVSNSDKVIGYKDSLGAMTYYTPEGGDASFSSMSITGLNGSGIVVANASGDLSVQSTFPDASAGLEWNYRATAGSSVGNGEVSVDNALPENVTEVYFNKYTIYTSDQSARLVLLDVNSQIILQSKDTASKYAFYDVTAQPTVSGDVYTFTVTHSRSGDTLVDGDGIYGIFGAVEGVGIVEYIDYDPQNSDPVHLAGRSFFNGTEDTFEVFGNNANVKKRIGQLQNFQGWNLSGTNIRTGDSVYVSDVSGTYLTIEPATALNTANNPDTGWAIAVAGQDIDDGFTGECLFTGSLLNADTTGLLIGKPIYLGVNGELTNDRPDYPARSRLLGTAITTGTNGVMAVYSQGDNYDYEFDGTITERHETEIVVDGTSVYMEVWNKQYTDRDLPLQIGGSPYLLNTTSGSGDLGRARVELTQGTTESDTFQWIYIAIEGGVAVLKQSVVYPSVPHAIVGYASILDWATTLANGALMHRRSTTAKSFESRGMISRILERLDVIGTEYDSGCTPTATLNTATTPDTLDLSTLTGIVYQKLRQTWPSISVSTDGAYLANGESGRTNALAPYTKATNLIDFCGWSTKDEPRNTNCRGHLVVWGLINKDTSECKLMVNVPNDLYGSSDSTAYADESNTAVYTCPKNLKKTAFLICRIQYDISSANDVRFLTDSGTSLTGENVVNLLGNPIGLAGGGSGGGGASIPTLFQVLSESNDAGGAQIKNGANATEAQDFTTLSQNQSLFLSKTESDSLFEPLDAGKYLSKTADDSKVGDLGIGGYNWYSQFLGSGKGAVSILGNTTAIMGATSGCHISNNYYYNDGTWYYKGTGNASKLELNGSGGALTLNGTDSGTGGTADNSNTLLDISYSGNAGIYGCYTANNTSNQTATSDYSGAFVSDGFSVLTKDTNGTAICNNVYYSGNTPKYRETGFSHIINFNESDGSIEFYLPDSGNKDAGIPLMQQSAMVMWNDGDVTARNATGATSDSLVKKSTLDTLYEPLNAGKYTETINSGSATASFFDLSFASTTQYRVSIATTGVDTNSEIVLESTGGTLVTAVETTTITSSGSMSSTATVYSGVLTFLHTSLSGIVDMIVSNVSGTTIISGTATGQESNGDRKIIKFTGSCVSATDIRVTYTGTTTGIHTIEKLN